MPLHGKIVVIKRSGGDGTEFPLTAACLFGRKPDCDIRIQLPQVSKEHCKIDLNENKEVILTNLSSVNPTRVNGEVLQQSERLKHGDLITILDRSFRFEYPPAPTPKKRRSTTVNKSETLQVLQDQQVTSTFLSEANKKSDLSSDICLKDGTNIVKLQQSDKSSVLEPKEDGRLDQKNTNSPFCELYEMVKQSLDSKTQRMTSESQPQTPASRFCTAKPVSPSKVEKFVIPTEDKNIVKTSEVEEGMKSEMTVVPVCQPRLEGTSTSEIVQVIEETRPMEEAMVTMPIQGTPKNKRHTSLPQTPITDGENTTPSFQVTPLKLTACEVVESLTVQNTPTRRKSKQSDSRAEEPKLPTDSVILSDEQTKVPAESQPSTPKAGPSRSPRTSPRTAEKKLKAQDILQTVPISGKRSVKKRKSGELEALLPVPEGKRKRVSFGSQLSPELFDKRLPPDSPLRKGATPSRRSLSVAKNKQSLLRRASVIGLIKEHPSPKAKASPGKKASPKRSVSSTKTPSPAKRSPKAKVISPAKAKTPSPSKDKSPKKKTKTPSPGSKSASKEVSQTPKVQKTPKSSSPAQSRKTPTAKRRSSLAVSPSDPQTASEVTGTPAKTPMSSAKHQTPTVQGRFSVSRIITPSPVAEHDSVPQSSATATPKVRRKSMKSAKKTAFRGVLEVMRNRRSGVSRASLKAVNSWADIVKFGQTKSQTLISNKKTTTKRKTTKKSVVPKPKTPARKLKEHASTGHADSPMTIVVGKAHKIRAVDPAVGAPKLVHNIALLPKNMKMDEDLTGVAEIFSTPACSKQNKSVSNAQSDIKTPLQIQSMSLIETSVMNTPEETGEMVVSPLSVVSTAKQGKYNSDAVSRLLQGNEESSFITEVAAQEDDKEEVSHSVDALEISSEEQLQESKIEMSTPKQKPEQPDCFTGVKRMMTTPKQKTEPVEDLRGKLLKTPRAPKVSEVVFDGVKELLETPKPVPVLDEAPDPSPLVCPTGITRKTKTPKEKGVPVEDMVGVKRIMKTPKVKGEMVEKNFGIERLIKTPRQKESEAVADFEGLQQLMQEPAQDETISPDLAAEQPQEVCQDSTEDASESSGDMQIVSQTDEVEMEEKDLATLEPQVLKPEEHTEDASVLSDGVHIVSPTVAVELPQLEVTKGTDLATEQPHVICEEHTEVSVPLDDTQIVSQRDAVETPQPEATDEKVEATNISTPLKKTQESEPADKDQHEMTLVSESSKTTAPDVPVRGRGRKKTEEIVHTSVRQSGRNRVAQTANEGTEAPVEDLAVVEKPIPDMAPASKPKRGRKAKQDAVEEAETLQNTDAVSNEITETEIATSQDPICDIALEKPRRGKKPKQSSAEPSVAVVVPRARRGKMIKQESAVKEVETVEVLQTESLETVKTSVPVEKPRRGRKVKQDSVEQADIVDVIQKESLEAIEPSVPVEKPRRGKKGKQESVEQAATVEESAVDIPVTEEEEVKVPASKPKRARKTKQDSVEQSCSEAASAETLVCQEQTIMAAEKPKRGGRRLKQDAVEQVNEPAVETASVVEPVENEVQEQAAVILAKPKRGGRKTKQDVEVEAAPAPTDKPDKTSVAPAEKPKRGRRTKQEVLTQEEKVDAEPSVETEALEEVDVPVTKPGRGRKVTAIVKEEIAPPSSAKKARRGATVVAVEAASEAAVPVTKSTTRGRGIKMSKDVSVITAEIQPELIKRGRRGAKSADAVPEKATSAEEIPVAEKMAVTEVEVKKGKGRLSKKVKDAGTVQADQTEVTQESDVENTRKPSKSVNWKAQLEMTQEIQNVTPVPARASRGRRAKIEEEPSAAESTPVKVGSKRKSLKTLEKAEESELSDPVPTGPVKRARRGAKSTDATPLTDITGATVEVTNASTSEAPEGPPAKGKGRVSKKGKTLSVDTEKNEEEEKSKPRRGRAGKL